MALNPVPVVVRGSGSVTDAPEGSFPINLYGVGTRELDRIDSKDGDVSVVAEDGGVFKVTVETADGTGIFRILDVGGLSALLTDENLNPLDSSWSPAGIVVHHDLDMRVPEPPASGTFTLQSVNGTVSWVSA